ncbi:hypothetical protein F4703DRAFT_1728721, partial [Phycomyces blakesleeanus]
YELINIRYTHQIASYETAKILATYLNEIKFQFRNKIRMLLNLLLEKNERIEAMKNSMKNSEEIEEDIATAVKENNDREYKLSKAEFISSATLDVIRNIFDTYPPDYQYSKGSIYYDSKANLLKHIKAYYRLSIMREVLRDKPFSCFPLQRWLIQCYMKIDTRTLNTLILNYSVIKSVRDINSKAIIPQGEAKDVKFRGMIYTDGIEVFVLKKNSEARK